LAPEANTLAKAITKNIPGFNMFNEGGKESANSLRIFMEDVLKKLIGVEFGFGFQQPTLNFKPLMRLMSKQ
jgi:hypothetical protein